MVKHTQTICLQKPTKCLSMRDHFAELALKGLTSQHANTSSTSYSIAIIAINHCNELFRVNIAYDTNILLVPAWLS